MRRTIGWLLPLLSALSLALVVLVQVPDRSMGSLAAAVGLSDRGLASAPNAAHLNQLPLYFTENGGQIDPQVSYYTTGSEASAYFTHRGLTLALSSHKDSKASPGQVPPPPQGWIVNQRFLGASTDLTPVAREPTSAVVSYFKGSPSQWQTGLHTYREIVYRDVWPGIDAVYSGTSSQLEYSFVVHPGADPGAISLAYDGASMGLSGDGSLRVTTPVASFVDSAPVAYQGSGHRRSSVPVSFALERSGEGQDRYGFRLGRHDPSRTLVIDPAVLVYAGYIGGARGDEADAIAVDGAGAAYLAGYSISHQYSFPVKVGPDLTYNAGYNDAFVAKVSPSGDRLVYAGYIGGAGQDYAYGIAVDGAGSAYVAGNTTSAQDSFPVKVGPDLTFNGGGEGDAFVAKVSPSGSHLVYAGYIGGAGYDYAYGIAVGGAGSAYLAGRTTSAQGSFPIKVGPDLTFNGGIDAFVAKVSPSGDGLLYAGYIGGARFDFAYAIAVGGAGAAYVSGNTNSPQASFPVGVGPDLTYNGGAHDAFVAKVAPSGSHLLYAGYIGGARFDYAYGIAVDGAGSAYVAGSTGSRRDTFPVKVGPDLTYNRGAHDAFVAEVSPSGGGFVYAGYIGGASDDYAYGIAVDGAGSAHVAGRTGSRQDSFPVEGGPDLTYNGGYSDAFVAKVSPSGAHLAYAGYIGGAELDSASGIDADGEGAAYVAGYTFSSQDSFPVKGGPDLTQNGYFDAFVAKVSPEPKPLVR